MNFIKSLCSLAVAALLTVPALAGDISKKDLSEVTKQLQSWPDESKKAADFMVKKYGKPDAVTDTMLVWNDVKPFKRSIVYKEAVLHKFPKEHKDVLEHFIDYEAPTADKVAEVWKFDGSVVLEKTKGEMSARCDREEANILALNLADDIIKGKRSVEEARMEYGRQILSLSQGNPQKLTQELAFAPSSSSAGDADESIMSKVKEMQAQEEKKDVEKQEEEVKTDSEEKDEKHQDEISPETERME